jgi:hypothetical protein
MLIVFRWVLVAIVTLLVLLTFHASSQDKEDSKLEINAEIDQAALDGKPESVCSAWLGYGLARSNWIAENILDDLLSGKTYLHSFDEEYAGREALATIWSELKESEPLAADKYLDELLSVMKAGFLREYVWLYLKSPDWNLEPEGLRLNEFKDWMKIHAKEHIVETLVVIKLGNEVSK